MSKKLYEESDVKAVADAIRAKNGSTGTYKLSEMAAAISEITTDSGIDTSDATATADDILLGASAYVNGEKIEGRIQIVPNTNIYKPYSTDNSLVYAKRYFSSAWYIPANEEVKMSILFSELAPVIGLTAEKILKGNTILGIAGTAGAKSEYEDAILDGTITNYENDTLTNVRAYAFAYSNLQIIHLYLAKTLDECVFRSCYDLVCVNIPKAQSLGEYTFRSCASLKVVMITQTDSICELKSTNVFQECYHFLGTVHDTYNPNGLKDGYIYVPDSMVDSYKAATNWSTFADQIKPLSEFDESVLNGV